MERETVQLNILNKIIGPESSFTPVQAIKTWLVRHGPRSPLVKLALAGYAKTAGFSIKFTDDVLEVNSENYRIVLNTGQFILVPIVMECFQQFFERLKCQQEGDLQVLDFSKPGFHTYLRDNATFFFPSMPEEDSLDAYTNYYTPKQGDVVWDLGAHAGATSYFLAQLVGPKGKVYAFEPDESNFGYLTGNVERLGLSNVVPVKKAVSGRTGSSQFHMEGTMCSGISEFMTYEGPGVSVTVETVTIEDACAELGTVPTYIKMDIEGAEIDAIQGSSGISEPSANTLCN